MSDECKLTDGIIHCQCGNPSSHYSMMGERSAREVRATKPTCEDCGKTLDSMGVHAQTCTAPSPTPDLLAGLRKDLAGYLDCYAEDEPDMIVDIVFRRHEVTALIVALDRLQALDRGMS